MWNEKSSAKRFEDRVYGILKRNYTQKTGWKIERYARLGVGEEVDFLLANSRRARTVVIDAKYKETLTTSDLRQLSAYRKKAKAHQAIFYVPRNISISESMEKTLARRKLGVHRTNIQFRKLWL